MMSMNPRQAGTKIFCNLSTPNARVLGTPVSFIHRFPKFCPSITMKKRTYPVMLTSTGFAAVLAASALAADQTWNTGGPSDVWNTTDLNWEGGVVWSDGNTAIFSGTGEAITVGTVSAAGMTFSGTDYVLNSGTINQSGTITASESATINSNITLGANQAWSAAATKTLTLGGAVSGSSTLTYGGGGSYVLGGNNTNSGNLTIDAASVTVNSGKTLFASGFGFSTLRTVTIQNSGKLVLPDWEYATVGHTSDGSNNFVITSGGVLEMTGATMNSGVNKGIQVTSGTGYFRTPNNTTWSGNYGGRDFQVSSGATLVFDGGGNFTNSRFVTGAGNVTKNDGGTLTLQSINSFSGTLTVNGGTLVASASTSSGSASATGNNNTIIVNSGAILKYTGSRGAGYHTGSVTINGGTVTFDNTDMSWGNGRTVTFDTTTGTINGTGQWRRRDSSNKVAVNAAASGSTISVAELNLFDSNPVFEVADGANAADLTITSTITGSSNLRKEGAGTLVLSGTSPTYAGTTQVFAGALLVNGTLGGAVTVNNAGTKLAGIGTIGGATTVNIGAIHSAGAVGAAGSQSFSNNLSYASGSIFEWDITTASNTADSVSVGGTLGVTTGAIFKVVSSTAFTDAFWDTTRDWNVFGGKVFDAFTLQFQANGISQNAVDFAAEGNFTFTNSGQTLTWTAVPEPASAELAGLLLTAGILRRRRH